jgi:hypothetical protein
LKRVHDFNVNLLTGIGREIDRILRQCSLAVRQNALEQRIVGSRADGDARRTISISAARIELKLGGVG